MLRNVLREKSSQSKKSHFFALCDDNRAISEIICRAQENHHINNSFLGAKLYKNLQVCLIAVKETK